MLLKEGEYVHLVIGNWMVNDACARYVRALRDFDLKEARNLYMEHINTLSLVCSDSDDDNKESPESRQFIDYLENNDLVRVIDMTFANLEL